MNKLNEKILKKIENKRVKMKSKSYFIALTTVYSLAAITVILFSLFLASFLFFSADRSGTNQFLSFGANGILPYLSSIPWILVLVLVILIVLVEIFGKKFDIVSKKPILYSFAALVIIVIGLGIVLAKTDMHENLFNKTGEGKFPIGRSFYENYSAFKDEQLIIAKILEINSEKLTVESQGKKYQINLDKIKNLPQRQDFFVNQEVIILGKIDKETIEVVGIHPYNGPKPIYRSKNIRIKGLLKNAPNSI